MMIRYSLILLLLLSAASITAQTITLQKGMTISQSCTVKKQVYNLTGSKADSLMKPDALGRIQPVITITGGVIDFQNAEITGNADPTRPDLFTGVAILVKSKGPVTIKNLTIKGFKVALLAEGVTNLTIENCNFSYNYRPKLLSGREKEDERDWLYYHQNDNNEWLRYGAAIYLDRCEQAMVRNCFVTGCQNALLMNRCNNATIYNNTFQYNSGLGIGLYRSSRNRVMHNKLDWNVRGYSHGFYARGQDSAAILCYEQCNNNLFAFNSCTHSGDGFFLWAGQSTMDSGQGGCNDNLIFGNDFSYAPTNGVEVTFSRNVVRGNLIKACKYGIWGGYSYGSKFMGNLIQDCEYGIAVEHGQNDTILQNLFLDDSTGIRVWARESQPADWGYAQKRDVRSRDWLIDRNVFMNVRRPLHIARSQRVAVNGENLFFHFENLLTTPQPNDSLRFMRNDIYGTLTDLEAVWKNPVLLPQRNLNFNHRIAPDQSPKDPYAPLTLPLGELNEPDSLPDGMLAMLPYDFPQGKQFIMVDEWGPYDFRRPILMLEDLTSKQAVFSIIGPAGDWKIEKMEGALNVDKKEGTTPAAISFTREAGKPLRLQLSYSGPVPITDRFGKTIEAGQTYSFGGEWR